MAMSSALVSKASVVAHTQRRLLSFERCELVDYSLTLCTSLSHLARSALGSSLSQVSYATCSTCASTVTFVDFVFFDRLAFK